MANEESPSEHGIESYDKLLDQVLEMKANELILSAQILAALDHSSDCIELAKKLNAKLTVIHSLCKMTMATHRNKHVENLAQQIIEVISHAD